MYVHEISTVVVEIPKCASTSLISAITSKYNVSIDGMHLALHQNYNRGFDIQSSVAVIRNPMDRLRSAANFSIQKLGYGQRLEYFRDELLESLERKVPSYHTAAFYPQYSFVNADAPINLYSLKNIDVMLSDLGIDDHAPVRNASNDGMSLDEILDVFGEQFVKEFYSLDFMLYDRVSSIGDRCLHIESASDYILLLKGMTK